MDKALRQVGQTVIIQPCWFSANQFQHQGRDRDKKQGSTEKGASLCVQWMLSSGHLLPTAGYWREWIHTCAIRSISKTFSHSTVSLQPQEEVSAIWHLLWNLVEIAQMIKKVPGRTDRPTDAPTECAIAYVSFHLENRLKTSTCWSASNRHLKPPWSAQIMRQKKNPQSCGCNLWSSFPFYFSCHC